MWLIGIAVFAYFWQQIFSSTTWFFVWDAPRLADDIWTRATPPRGEYITQLGNPIWDTLNIATLGTIFSLIWALLLIAIICPRVFAGVIAVAIRSIGFCAKLLYEAIEEIDQTQVEADTATGSSRWHALAFGIAPQVLPAFARIAVFRWDISVRESTVLGLIGAG